MNKFLGSITVRKVIFTIICFVLNSSFLVLHFSLLVSASIVDKTHVRTFNVKDEYVEVIETKTTVVSERGFQIPAGSKDGFTIFTPIPGDPDEKNKLDLTLDSIVVTDANGAELDYELEETDSKNYIIKVTNPNILRTGQEYKINLKYNSYGLLINTGAIKDIYIPGFPEDYEFESSNFSEEVTTKIEIPNNYPEINFTSPTQQVTDSGSVREISIPTADLIGNSVWIQLGTKQYFSFEIEQRMPKTSNIPFALNTFTLPVPRDIHSGPITQKVYYKEISPTPYAVNEDGDGNLMFTFKESASQNHDIKIKGFATLEQNQNFDLTNAGKLSDISSPDFSTYLNGAKYWEVTDPQILGTAKEIAGDETDVYKIIQKTYDFVINRIDYSFVKKSGLNERQGALATLNGTAAVCMEYSDLFITLLRAQGIPARAAFGYGFGTSDFESRNENTINHQWAEVYLPAQNTWVNVDTTWGEFGNELLGGDLNHFYSHVASVDPETPSTSKVSFFGALAQIPDRTMEINIQNSIGSEEFSKADTQEDLIKSYPEKSDLQETIYTIKSQFRIFDKGVENIARGITNSDNQAILSIFKIIIYLLPFLMVVGIVFATRKLKRKKKNTIKTIEVKSKATTQEEF